jgi:hypothetical protein
MQVFAPFEDIEMSVWALDPKRLGNQIYRENLTLIRGGWPNHPASKIWANHKKALAEYSLAGLAELKLRGRDYPHHVETFQHFFDTEPDTGFPPLWGREDYHRSHQSNLIRKNPDWYIPIFGDVPKDLEYVWR